MGKKISNGPNARPRDETIAQSGGGLPDDSSRVPEEVSETAVAAARRGLEKIGQPQAKKEKAAEREQSTEVGPGTAAGRTQD